MISFKGLPINTRYVSSKLIVGAKQGLNGLRTLRNTENVTQVIDLRKSKDAFLEKFICKRLGIKYTNIPIHMPDGSQEVKDAFIKATQEIANNKSGKTFIHCRHGKHRSVLAAALFEVFENRIKNQKRFEKFIRKHLFYDVSPKKFLGITIKPTPEKTLVKLFNLQRQKEEFLKLFPFFK